MNFIGPYSDCPLHEIPRYQAGRPIHLRKVATTKGLPVSLADVKLDLRVDSDDEDDTVRRMIRGACAFLERRTGIVFLAGRYEAHFDGFYDCPWEFQRFPFRSMAEVAYLSTAHSPASWVDLGVDDFLVTPRQASFLVTPLQSFTAPSSIGAPFNGVRVRFDAGFDPVYESGESEGELISEGEEDEPQPIEDDATTLLIACVAHFYENRELFAADRVAEIEAKAGSLFTSRRKFW